jgi:hypothetical protein
MEKTTLVVNRSPTHTIHRENKKERNRQGHHKKALRGDLLEKGLQRLILFLFV